MIGLDFVCDGDGVVCVVCFGYCVLWFVCVEVVEFVVCECGDYFGWWNYDVVYVV